MNLCLFSPAEPRLASNRADELIEGKSRGWTLQRMPVIDVAIMRMALFELLEAH